MPANDTQQALPQPSTAYVSYVVVVCLIVYTVSFVDRQILAILLSPIKQELGLKDVHLGLLTGTAFGLFYAVLGVPIGRIADRYSRRNVMAICITLWSVMTALCGTARSFTHLLLYRVGVGVGEAGGSPPAVSLISDIVPERLRARALAVYSLGVPAGVLIGFLCGGYLREYFGWRTAFVVVGLPGVLVAVLLLLTVKEPPRPSRANLPPVGQVARFLWHQKAFRYLSLASGCFAFAAYSQSFMLPLFLERSYGLGPVRQGQVGALAIGLGGAVGALIGGVAADAWAKRDVRGYVLIPAIGQFCAAGMSVLCFGGGDIVVVIVTLLLITVGSQMFMAPSLAASQSLSTPAMRVTAAALLFFTINIIGLMFGPAITGWLSDFLAPEYEEESLRYALLAVSVTMYSLAGCLYVLASRTLRADYARAQASQ